MQRGGHSAELFVLLLVGASGPYGSHARIPAVEAVEIAGHSLIQYSAHHSIRQSFSARDPEAAAPATLDFEPFSLDNFLADSFDASDLSRRGQLQILEASDSVSVAGPLDESSGGVLCRTLLHPAVHDEHFISFAAQSLGLDLANKLDEAFQQKCKNAYTADAWENLQYGYTGNWTDNSVIELDNTIFGAMGQWLNEERQKNQSKAPTWNDFRNGDTSDDSGMTGLLRHIAKEPPTTSLTRILDFGCGDGVEVSKISRGLGLAQENTLCLDITDYVAKEARSNVTFLLAPGKVPDYGNALKDHLDSKQLRGTVSAAFSSVTFHHITEPEMRTAALTFVRESLTADGFFLLAEWDNIGTPIDYTIYFDLAHFLPQLFFVQPAPTTAKLGALDTCYLSVQGWKDMMGANGLPFSAARSRLPFRGKDNSTIWLDPPAAAGKTSGRNFLAVFGK